MEACENTRMRYLFLRVAQNSATLSFFETVYRGRYPCASADAPRICTILMKGRTIMLFIKDLNVFHIDGKEIPCITASGTPDDRYPGVPGVLYMDTDTGSLYICIDADILQKTYSWRIVGGVDIRAVQQAVAAYMANHPVSGGGITSAAANLLIELYYTISFFNCICFFGYFIFEFR